MLQLYDTNHNKINGITKAIDLKIESELSTGDKTLSFFINKDFAEGICEEGYITTKKDEFVIKSINGSGQNLSIIANLNIEELEGKPIEFFEFTKQTANGLIATAIAGTGWTIGKCDITKKRTIRLTNTSAWGVIQEVKKVFRCDIEFDSINKSINIYSKRGTDKGVYFIESLNLISLSTQSDTFEYYTRIIPIGKDDLRLEAPGYINNNQYTNKVKTLIWKDERYTDIESLREDATAKLEELSKPYKAYSANVRDMAALSEKYNILNYSLGDEVTLISKSNKVKIKQRIVKLIEYPYDPNKNTCELANTTLKFEDTQMELEATKDTVNNITTDNGTIDGSKVDGITTEQIKDFKEVTITKAEVKELVADKASIGELNAVKADIGELRANTATIEDLKATNAEIKNLKADKADITDLNATNATIGNLNADVANIQTLVNGNLSSENIQAAGITSDRLTIETGFIKDAMIDSLSANKIDSGSVNTSQVDITSDSGGIRIADNTMQFTDKNNKVRIQMGEDANKDFTFSLFDETGTGVLIDSTGIKEKALSEGIIKEGHIGTGAVTGNKIDWNSFATEFNKETNTNSIKASKVELDGTSQKLNIAFNEMKTQVTETASKTETATTELKMQQGKIETLIANTTITKDGKTTQLKDEYNKTVDTVNSHSQTLGQHTSKLDEATGKITAVETKTNKVEKDLSGTTSTVNAHATKIGALETKTSNHETKITQNTDAIKLKASKTEVAEAVADVKVGGENIFHNTGYEGKTVNDVFNTSSTGWISSAGVNKSLVKYTHSNNKPEDKFIKGKSVLYFNYDMSEGIVEKVINPAGEDGDGIIELKPNTEYTLSGYLYAGGGSTGDLWWNIWSYDDSKGNRVLHKKLPTEPTWTGKFVKYEHTFTTGASKYYQVRFYARPKVGVTTGNIAFNMYQMKLEEGNKATAWKPSPADTYSDMDKKITDAKAEISIETGKITTRVEDVEQIQKNGGNNLLPNSNWAEGVTEGWRITGTPTRQFLSGSAVPEDKSGIQLGSATNVTANTIYVDSPKVFVAPGTDLTLSIIGYALANTTCRAYLLFSESNKPIEEDNTFITGFKSMEWTTTSYVKKSITDKVPSGVNYCFVRLRIDKKDTANKNDFTGNFTSIMLVKGIKEATWQPSQKDAYLYTKKQYADTQVTIKGITDRVGAIEGSYVTESKFTQEKNNITAAFEQRGGSNVVRNGTGLGGVEYWHANVSVGETASAASESKKTIRCTNGGATTTKYAYTHRFAVDPNTTYTVSFAIRNDSAKGKGATLWALQSGLEDTEDNKLNTTFTKSLSMVSGVTQEGFLKVTKTFTTEADAKSMVFRLDNLGAITSGTSSYVYITDLVMVKGKVASSWMPHFSETYNTRVILNENGVKCGLKDGEYAQMGKDGFKWHKGGNARDYHALSYVGSMSISKTQSANQTAVWVTLPSEFKGKTFDVVPVLKGYDLGYGSSSFVVDRYSVAHATLDYEGGRFQVVGDCRVYNKSNASDIQYIGFNVAYIVVA